MGFWMYVKNDVKTDSSFGDFELNSNDLKMNQNPLEILEDVVKERFKTSLEDFILNPNYGSNIKENLGKGLDMKLADRVIASLKYSLTYDNFLSHTDFNIVPIILKNELKLYTYIHASRNDVTIVSVISEGVIRVE